MVIGNITTYFELTLCNYYTDDLSGTLLSPNIFFFFVFDCLYRLIDRNLLLMYNVIIVFNWFVG